MPTHNRNPRLNGVAGKNRPRRISIRERVRSRERGSRRKEAPVPMVIRHPRGLGYDPFRGLV